MSWLLRSLTTPAAARPTRRTPIRACCAPPIPSHTSMYPRPALCVCPRCARHRAMGAHRATPSHATPAPRYAAVRCMCLPSPERASPPPNRAPLQPLAPPSSHVVQHPPMCLSLAPRAPHTITLHARTRGPDLLGTPTAHHLPSPPPMSSYTPPPPISVVATAAAPLAPRERVRARCRGRGRGGAHRRAPHPSPPLLHLLPASLAKTSPTRLRLRPHCPPPRPPLGRPEVGKGAVIAGAD